jgi:hypothetical protein
MELRNRLPRLWRRVTDGDLAAGKARLVARETTRLSVDAAGYVDRQVAPSAHRLRTAQLERLVAEAIGRFMPEELERLAAASWDKRHVTVHEQLVSLLGRCGSRRSSTSPTPWTGGVGRTGQFSRAVPPRRVVLHVHLSEEAVLGNDPVAHLERDNALVTVEQVRAWCGHPDAQVVVKPVLDLAACVEVDCDHVPERIAEQVAVRDRTCVFPWCSRPARRCRPDDVACDNDHVRPRAGGGDTCSCNLAPLCRRHHRLKTHAPWSYLVLEPGTYLWTTPHGYQFLRDPSGTLDVSPDRPRPVTSSDPPTLRGDP